MSMYSDSLSLFPDFISTGYKYSKFISKRRGNNDDANDNIVNNVVRLR